MLPVLYRFTFETPFSRILLYLLGAAIVAYGAWNGWKSAVGPLDREGKPTEPTTADRRNRAFSYALIGAAIALFGIYYALPASALPEIPVFGKGKGEGIPIHTYGVMIGLGFLSAVTASAWMAVREWPGMLGLERRDQIYDLAFWLFLGGIAGSRIHFVLVNLKDYLAHPSRFFDLSGGLVFQGGVVGAAVAAYFYSKRHGIEFLRLADLAIPTVSLGAAFGRLGCFAAGCCWGKVTTHARSPFAVEFPGAGVKDIFGGSGGTASLAYQSMADSLRETRWVVESTGQVTAQAVDGAVRISEWVTRQGHTLPVHPSQLYDSFGQILLFVGFLTLRRWRRFHGQVFFTWIMVYAIHRIVVETFRGDAERGTLHGWIDSVPFDAWYNFSQGQLFSVIPFLAGAFFLFKNLREVRPQPTVDLAGLTATG